MNRVAIKQRLIYTGYPERLIDAVSNELLSVSEILCPIVEKWVESGEEEDYSYIGYSLRELCDKRNLKYPAAILTLDWLIKEPNEAIQCINRRRR